ncbi:unnamed protein product [Ilex paraguariensis]|uniref:BZIP domain-containing protein n=1 Tax=Ilex paraguariensis TaxID=185542 RepID=A0ABC8SE94_9AQUA
MASSKLLASSTSRNSDLRRKSSLSSSSTKSSTISQLHTKHNHTNSMTVDGFLRNVYDTNHASENTLLDAEITLLDAAGAVTAISDNEAGPTSTPIIRRQESVPRKTLDDVWREIVEGKRERKECKEEAMDEMMTLEVFLAKAGAVEEEEDVKIETETLSGGVSAFDSPVVPARPASFAGTPAATPSLDGVNVVGYGNGVEVIGGRGKRRGTILEPLDKAAQQRQKRMIKNRESAARSRERKQAYQVELESIAVRLEEENERLLKEKELEMGVAEIQTLKPRSYELRKFTRFLRATFKEIALKTARLGRDKLKVGDLIFGLRTEEAVKAAEHTKERFKQLMEKVVPVVEKRRPARVLRRVRSMQCIVELEINDPYPTCGEEKLRKHHFCRSIFIESDVSARWVFLREKAYSNLSHESHHLMNMGLPWRLAVQGGSILRWHNLTLQSLKGDLGLEGYEAYFLACGGHTGGGLWCLAGVSKCTADGAWSLGL